MALAPRRATKKQDLNRSVLIGVDWKCLTPGGSSLGATFVEAIQSGIARSYFDNIISCKVKKSIISF